MEKKKFKFNVVDAIIILVIVAAVAIIGVKLIGESAFSENSQKLYEISFLCEEVPDFAAEIIEKGDEVVCEMSDNSLGVVQDVVIEPSRTYATTADGNVILTSKDHYNCVTLNAKVIADEYEHGLMVKKAKYGVGHSITIRVGKAKIFGRISGIEFLRDATEDDIKELKGNEEKKED